MKHPSHCVLTVDTFINNDYAQQSNIYRFCKHVCKIISQLHNNKEDEL